MGSKGEWRRRERAGEGAGCMRSLDPRLTSRGGPGAEEGCGRALREGGRDVADRINKQVARMETDFYFTLYGGSSRFLRRTPLSRDGEPVGRTVSLPLRHDAIAGPLATMCIWLTTRGIEPMLNDLLRNREWLPTAFELVRCCVESAARS